MRLYRRDVLRRAASTLQSILERESRGWFLHFRERHAAQLASQKMPLKDIEEVILLAGKLHSTVFYIAIAWGIVSSGCTIGNLM